MTISKQPSRKDSGQSVTLTFLKLHILLIAISLGISLSLLRVVPGCSFVVMMIFIICIDLFQYVNLRSSLPGDDLEKKCSLYIRGTPRKTNAIYLLSLTFFPAEVLKFCQLCILNSFI